MIFYGVIGVLIGIVLLFLFFYMTKDRTEVVIQEDTDSQRESVIIEEITTQQEASNEIDTPEIDHKEEEEMLIIPEGKTIRERFTLPKGYTRIQAEENSFAEYLQNLTLKPHGAKVSYFDGREKSSDVYLAVVDFSLGKRDLQQCADAIIRLRAEYLYAQNRYSDIHFNFVSGFNAEFVKWSQGNGILVEGNQVSWVAKRSNTSSYESFQKYLDMVYAYASTLSLEKELNFKEMKDLAIGDVFIKGGSPGHCVIVVDMIMNSITGEKQFMLAQSYMPAQDIQVLKGDSEGSPWYTLPDNGTLNTPEWSFSMSELKAFSQE